MELNEKQQRGLEIAVQRFRQHKKYTVISGYAGTGKSTLVRFIIDALGVSEDKVVYTAFTGKATQVLARKGNKNVSTLHKLLYDSFPKKDGTFFRKPKAFIEYSIVIVDEVSMAPKELMELLFRHDVHIICLGDPFQLPPVEADNDNHLLDEPHIFLDEIMRQEAESEIIQLTMAIRSMGKIGHFKGKEVQVLNKDELNEGLLEWPDQILTGTNKARAIINQQMRALKGLKGDKPLDGDKMICLHNYWNNLSDQDNALVNGTIGYIHDKYDTKLYLPRWVGGGSVDVTCAKFTSDIGEDFGELQMDTHKILTGERCITPQTAYRLAHGRKNSFVMPYDFEYGYAITTHRAQGSQWGKILVIEEYFPKDPIMHARWLYTACTRAEKQLVLVRS